MRHKILMVIDRPGWAYDICAKGLSAKLSHLYDFEFIYVIEQPFFYSADYDIIYIYWWGEKYCDHLVQDKNKIIKEVSSHRWENDVAFGLLKPNDFVDKYLSDATTIIATSKIIESLLKPHCTNLFYCHNGYDSKLFFYNNDLKGPMRIGWVGSAADVSKGFDDILRPLAYEGYVVREATGSIPHDKLNEFYNDIDIICIASIAEGTPLPLIEGMACGCFAISTNVGVAPELIEEKANGLIVERSFDGFSKALKWCEANLSYIRASRKSNADKIKAQRSWDIAADNFRQVFDGKLEQIRESKEREVQMSHSNEPNRATNENNNKNNELLSLLAARYESHLKKINPGTNDDATFHSVAKSLEEEIMPLLPVDRNARILEVGIGYGHLIRLMLEKGYKNITGVDNCSTLLKLASDRLGNNAAELILSDGLDYLKSLNEGFDVIVLMDVIEHFSLSDAYAFCKHANLALNKGGKLLIRTPNMSNIAGIYSRYIDLTHLHGYTDYSLRELFSVAGFTKTGVHVPTYSDNIRERFYRKTNNLIHKIIFRIQDRSQPLTFDKNIVAWAEKGSSFLAPK